MKKATSRGRSKYCSQNRNQKKRTFRKEKGWRATIEIIDNQIREQRTVYARGLCMNVLYHGVGEDIANQIFTNAKVDNSGITFEPVSCHAPQGKWKPDEFSIDFVKPGWKIFKTKIAEKFVRTQKMKCLLLHPWNFARNTHQEFQLYPMEMKLLDDQATPQLVVYNLLFSLGS